MLNKNSYNKLFRHYFLVILGIFTFQNGYCQLRAYHISGKLNGTINGEMRLFFDNNFKKRDSLISPINDSSFQFEGKIMMPIRARITMGDESYVVDVFLDDSNTQIVLHNEVVNNLHSVSMNKLELMSASGSSLQKLRDVFEDSVNMIFKIEKIPMLANNRYYNLLFSLAKDFPKSIVTPYEIAKADGLNSRDIATLIGLLDTSLEKTFEYNQAKIFYKNLAKSEIEIGSVFIDSLLMDENKKWVRPGLFFGKLTLVEFWASWCGPCRERHPGLMKLKEDYGARGFQILGISLDEQSGQWMKAIKTDGLTWPQLIDLKGTGGDFGRTYDLDRIPFNFLLDSKGKIIAKELSVDDLRSILRQKLGN
jgi:thiol-disulfide isomerase/thioredoxin